MTHITMNLNTDIPVGQCSFSDDGTLLAVVADRKIQYWNVRTGVLVDTVVLDDTCCASSRGIVQRTASCTIVRDLWQRRPLICVDTTIYDPVFAIGQVPWRAVMTLILAARRHGIRCLPAELWAWLVAEYMTLPPAAIGTSKSEFRLSTHPNPIHIPVEFEHPKHRIHCIVFSPDNRMVATVFGINPCRTCNPYNMVHVWDVCTGQLLATVPLLSSSAYSCSFTHDSTALRIDGVQINDFIAPRNSSDPAAWSRRPVRWMGYDTASGVISHRPGSEHGVFDIYRDDEYILTITTTGNLVSGVALSPDASTFALLTRGGAVSIVNI